MWVTSAQPAMLANARPSYRLAAALALATTVFAIAPVLHVGWWESHDMVAYPVRLIELCRAWSAGTVWPRWAVDTYGGRGSPLFNFYPPGAVVPGAPLYLLGTTAYFAMKAAVFFYTAVGLFAAFLVGELLTGRRDAGIVSMAAFATTPYRYTQLVIRGDLAEYCATSLALLALYAYLSIDRRGATPRRCLFAACAHASIVLTHTVTGQWSTELLGLLVGAWMAKAWHRGERHAVVTYALTFGGALGLTCIYVVPALWERHLVRVVAMATGHFATENNFVTELQALLQPGFFFVGWAALVVLPCGLIGAARSRRLDLLACTAVSVALLVLMNRVSAPLWRVLPFGHYTMFPWRLLGLLAVTLCPLVALLWQLAVRERTRATDLALLACIAMLASRAQVERPVPKEVATSAMPADAAEVSRQLHSTVVFNEYLPAAVTHPPHASSWTLVRASSPGVVISTARRDGMRIHVVAQATERATIVFDRHAYPGWQATTLGEHRAAVDASGDGLLQLTLPEAGSYDVTIDMGTTLDRALATFLTLATLALLPLALRLWLRRRPAGVA